MIRKGMLWTEDGCARSSFGAVLCPYRSVLANVEWLLERVRDHDGPVHLAVGGDRALGEIRTVFALESNATLFEVSTTSAAMGQYVRSTGIEVPPPPPQWPESTGPKAQPLHWIVATDGSVSTSGRYGGWAWVSDTGSAASGVRHRQSIRDVEAYAIRDVMKVWWMLPRAMVSGSTLTILSDSRDAIALCRSQMGPVTAKSVTIKWIRGHGGHPLNEAADEIAVRTRRFGRDRDWAKQRATAAAEAFTTWVGPT